jgi:hypothetical protein
MSHAGILHFLSEQKKKEASTKLEAAVSSLKEICPDLEAQERMDLMSTIFDLEDIHARLQSTKSDAPVS